MEPGSTNKESRSQHMRRELRDAVARDTRNSTPKTREDVMEFARKYHLSLEEQADVQAFDRFVDRKVELLLYPQAELKSEVLPYIVLTAIALAALAAFAWRVLL